MAFHDTRRWGSEDSSSLATMASAAAFFGAHIACRRCSARPFDLGRAHARRPHFSIRARCCLSVLSLMYGLGPGRAVCWERHAESRRFSFVVCFSRFSCVGDFYLPIIRWHICLHLSERQERWRDMAGCSGGAWLTSAFTALAPKGGRRIGGNAKDWYEHAERILQEKLALVFSRERRQRGSLCLQHSRGMPLDGSPALEPCSANDERVGGVWCGCLATDHGAILFIQQRCTFRYCRSRDI